MQTIGKFARLYIIAVLVLWIVPALFFATVDPDDIGVRQSNFTGVAEQDIDPGWALRIPGVQKIIQLPRRYEYLDYSRDPDSQSQLQIRTRDNNIVFIDASVPYRIIPGHGWRLVQAGNHQKDADGSYRFQRLAGETTVSVLREHLADLRSADFYSTDRRLEVAGTTLEKLNEKLAELNLEAERVLIRAVQFRPEYERQLQQIQLNEQKKLLDEAAENVAREQQTLDNFVQATNARASAVEQGWIEHRANLERAFEVGFVEADQDEGPRAVLAAMSEDDRQALVIEAAKALGIDEADEEAMAGIGDAQLLGIKNIQAETLEYGQRIRSEADGVSARLAAEGDALVATVRGEFEGKVNALLNSAAGRAYVAWKSADNIKFNEKLIFHSSDGIPSVLRLREFTEHFMGRK
jgi:regulator of protease activity HflC (stomatin/prohibitin superfamily)